MHRAQSMVKARVCGARKNEVEKTSLGNPAQPLKIRMFDDIKKNFVRNIDKPVNRIVDDFKFIGHKRCLKRKICP